MAMSSFTLCSDGVREVVEPSRAVELMAGCQGKVEKLNLAGKSLTLPAARVIAEKLESVSGVKHFDMSDIIASRPEDGKRW